jgi:DNA-binding transcriptional MerR regulator
MSYSVGQVAGFARTTVRTLHHYDEIKLLSPSGRTAAGYRRYDDADLDRLQQILFYRELGFSLEEIATILDDRDIAPSEHLRRQHALLTGRIERLQRMAAAVEEALEARTMGIKLTPEEKFEIFGEGYQEYEDEAQERWGGTDVWEQSRRRTAELTKDDWIRIKAEQDAAGARLAAALAAGLPADSPEAMDAAEQHRLLIDRYFYDLSRERHVGLGELYLADPRFTRTYEDLAPGLAQYVHDAIVANSVR